VAISNYYCTIKGTRKNETIVSVIKRLFGEHIRSRLVRTQNRELSFRCVAYNAHRLTDLCIIIDGFYKAILKQMFLKEIGANYLSYIQKYENIDS